MRARILVVDDEQLIRWSLSERLTQEGYEVVEAGTAKEAVDTFTPEIDVVLLDYRLPDSDGLRVLKQIKAIDADVPVIMLTAVSGVETAVEAMKQGAHHYATKPFNLDEIAVIVEKALETTALRREVRSLRRSQGEPYGMSRIVGDAPAMQALKGLLQRVAASPASTVLLTGESGTGKDLVARTIHRYSGRKDLPYVAVNCGAIPETLVEAELFGYEKGSFTGAIRSQAGYFERAGRGTLFLDEIGEMPLEMQVKLLRALESGVITRIGGAREVPVQARVLAATNRSPSEAVAAGQLRSDLLYRLAVFHIIVPSLRERGADVELLARHFLNRLNRSDGTRKRFSPDSRQFLRENTWPGNVRELHNVIQRAFILADDELDLRNAANFNHRPSVQPADEGTITVTPGMALADMERMMIAETLKSCRGNKTRAAAVLGISLKTLYNRLNEYKTSG